MSVRKFSSLEEACIAGFTVVLGNGEYAEGGSVLSRDRYPELFKVLEAQHREAREFCAPPYPEAKQQGSEE